MAMLGLGQIAEKNFKFLVKTVCIIGCCLFIDVEIVIHRNCGKLVKAKILWITL